jgi:hypothetical protein
MGGLALIRFPFDPTIAPAVSITIESYLSRCPLSGVKAIDGGRHQ